MKDSLGRNIEYMRISITDRCNLRCRYCMPEEGIEKISMSQILTFEEIGRICKQAVQLGITRFKITGGEPLVRRGCPDLIRMIGEIHGVEQVTLTTNGQLLGEYLDELVDAGLDGVNVSLDSLDGDRYRMITRGGELGPVLGSIDKAAARGIRTKVNCLLQEGINEDELMDFANMAFDKGIDVRFIETMPVGFADAEIGMSNEEALLLLQRQWPELSPDNSVHGNGPAVYYHIPGRAGAIGFISPLHGKFCDQCNRIRLTSTGMLKPCLCYDESIDIRKALEESGKTGSDQALRDAVASCVMAKPADHCFLERERSEGDPMVEIGG